MKLYLLHATSMLIKLHYVILDIHYVLMILHINIYMQQVRLSLINNSWKYLIVLVQEIIIFD